MREEAGREWQKLVRAGSSEQAASAGGRITARLGLCHETLLLVLNILAVVIRLKSTDIVLPNRGHREAAKTSKTSFVVCSVVCFSIL